MNAIAVLEKSRTQIEALCAKYGVLRLRLFGSSVRQDWNFDRSDFDFLADFGEPPAGIASYVQLFGFIADLEELLGRHVDVVDLNAVSKPNFKENATIESQEWYAA
ncbi:MAG TPA: nucleotidyltransferase domain-containing protein [Fimbriimonadaceae bacterium]|jgi:hypothetical protein